MNKMNKFLMYINHYLLKYTLFPGIELENMVIKVYMKMNVAYTSLAASRITNVDDQCRW